MRLLRVLLAALLLAGTAALTWSARGPVAATPAAISPAEPARSAHTGRGTPVGLRGLPGQTSRHWPAATFRPGAPGTVRVVQVRPRRPVAELLFVHGHADRADNHRELFAAWVAAGIQVTAVDLPSHGLTRTSSIDAWNAADLARLLAGLDRLTGHPGRPLLLAGWSYGGLQVARMLQDPALGAALPRRPAAALLLTPAVAPRPFVGGDGTARLSSLTHRADPPVAGPPAPANPLSTPVFAGRLLVDAWQARHDRLPAGTPVLVVTSGAGQDRYVDPAATEAWVADQRTGGAPVTLVRCPGARHALDLEPWPVGPAVRTATVRFLASTVPGIRAPDLADQRQEAACPVG